MQPAPEAENPYAAEQEVAMSPADGGQPEEIKANLFDGDDGEQEYTPQQVMEPVPA